MIGIMAIALLLASCGGDTKSNTADTSETDTAPPNADQAKEIKYKIDTEKSVVKWRGAMLLGVHHHTGTLKFKDGSFKAVGENITEGGLTVDMSTMVATDANFNEEHKKEDLIGHLGAPDFFDIANFAVASVIFKGDGKVALSIRDKSNVEQITDLEVKEVDGKKVYTAKLEFDRQKYGVAYTGAEDSVISDDVELEVELYTL